LQQHLRPPDAVVTDFRLGDGANGIELIAQLRALTDAALPALLVTAETQLPQAVGAKTQVLQKPVGAAKLLAALARSISDQS
jgi:DNA-binding NtrC family response regulator